MVNMVKVAAGLVGGVASIPIALKVGGMIRDVIFYKAQNPDDIVTEEACSISGYSWYKRKCHAEPEPERVVTYCCLMPGHKDLCFPTYEELVEHYRIEHPEALIPPKKPELVVRIIRVQEGF